MAKITDIEGIGDSYAEKLAAANVKTTDALLEMGATPAGRKKIAADSGIGDSLISRWVNHADLFRIKGVAGEYAELLEAAGVDTVVELAQRRADNLRAKMEAVNTEKKLVRALPSESQVSEWVAQAKTLPRKLTY
jgi:predicted flap endonuclease-1-like 5' DNA nuclease